MTVMMIVVVLAVIMRMIVMLVIVTVLGVTMIMFAMIVVAVLVTAMIVVIMRGMAAASVGAALGIERGFDDDHACAEAAHHVFDHMIAADAKTLADDLRRQMPVAEVPGDPHEMVRIGAANFHQRFGRSDHLDQPPVFQHQRIAAAERDGLLQVEQEFQPVRAGHRHPPPVPVVEAEDHRIGGGLGPANLREHLRRADHDVSFCTSPPIMTSILVGDALNDPESVRHAFRCGVRRCAAR